MLKRGRVTVTKLEVSYLADVAAGLCRRVWYAHLFLICGRRTSKECQMLYIKTVFRTHQITGFWAPP
jgi:hypothetical protein